MKICIIVFSFICLVLFPVFLHSNPQTVLLIDKFENYPQNALGGSTGSFSDSAKLGKIFIETETESNAFDGTGKSLSLKYIVKDSNCFCGYYSQFTNLDLSQYNYLSFWIRGEQGKEYLQIQLANETDTAKVAIWNYLCGGPTESWQKVVIPLDAFWNLKSKNNILELVFVFENYQSSVNNSPMESKVYIDDIICGTYFPGFVKIDHFDDKLKSHATGGNIGEFCQTGTEGLYTSKINCNVFHNEVCGLEIAYDNSQNAEFGGLFFVLGGGDSGWTKIYKDISAYNHLHIASRGGSSSTNPGNFKVELKSINITYSSQITDVSTSYKEDDKYFDSDFIPSFSSAEVGEFTFVFERNKQEKLKGILHVDEIELRSSWYAGVDNERPPKPSCLLVNSQNIDKCQYVSGTFQVSSSLNSNISKTESVRFQYRGDYQSYWTTVDRKYIFDNNQFTWNISASDLPDSCIIDLRVVAQNYNGMETSSDIVYVKTAPFDLTLADLFSNSFQLFQLFRHNNGIYRDALRFDGNHFHPASIAVNGMGLISLCIGDAMNWIDNAPQLVEETLRILLNKDNKLEYNIRNANGYYKHFFNIDTGAPMWSDEYSSIDTGILMCGGLFCKNYFSNNQAISQFVEELWNSIDWTASIASADSGEIYLKFDESGNGIENAKTKPYNEYIIVAWLAMNQENGNGGPATDLWNKYYSDPSGLPNSSYNGINVLTDRPGHFLSSFTFQFSYYLCNYFSSNDSYVQFFNNARKADYEWWLEQQKSKDYEWGCGAGSDFPPDYYHPDAIEDNPHTIFSPHIIAGFLPVFDNSKQHLLNLITDGKTIYGMANNKSLKILWRHSSYDPFWQAEDIQGVDFSTMLFGLATLNEHLGLNFFLKNNSTNANPTNKNTIAPNNFILHQNYPNPFNPSTTIIFSLCRRENVHLEILNINGRTITSLLDSTLDSGEHKFTWDGKNKFTQNVASGIYFLFIRIGDFTSTKKLVLLR